MNMKQSAFAAVIGGAFLFAPATPAEALTLPGGLLTPATPRNTVAADPANKTTEERLKDIEQKLDTLTQILKGKRDSDGYPLSSDPGLVAEVKKLKDDLASLKKQLDDMQKSTSLRPSGNGTDAMAGKGTVRVVNDYPVEITIVVNDNSHRVAPNTKLDITVPAGTFTYQLISAGTTLTPTRSTIKEKEIVTLRIK